MDSKIYKMDQAIFYSLCLYALGSSIAMAIANIGMGLACVLFLVRLYFKRDDVIFRLKSVDKLIWIAIGAFIMSAFLSAVTSNYFHEGIKEFFNSYVYRPLPLLVIIGILRKQKECIMVFSCMIVSLLANEIWALAEFTKAIVNGTLYAGNMRFSGNLHPVHYGGVLSGLVPALLALGVNMSSGKYRNLVFFSYVISCVALILSGTRAAWIAVGIMSILIVVLYIKNKMKLLLVLGVAICLAGSVFVFVPQLSNRISTITDMNYQSNSERLLMWKSAINMYKDYPVFGIGLGSYRYEYKENYMSPLAKERDNLAHAHSNIFHTLAEKGTVGIISYTILFFTVAYISFMNWKRKKEVVALMLFTAWIGLMIQGLTEFNIGMSVTGKLYWLIVGLYLCWYTNLKMKIN